MRELVQGADNHFIDSDFRQRDHGFRAPNRPALALARFTGSLNDAGSGMLSVTEITWPGLVPQVT